MNQPEDTNEVQVTLDRKVAEDALHPSVGTADPQLHAAIREALAQQDQGDWSATEASEWSTESVDEGEASLGPMPADQGGSGVGETYAREQLLSEGVEAIAKRRWEHAQSAGPFAALGPSWEQVRRDPSKWEQRDKYLVPARHDVEAGLAAIDGAKEGTDGD